MGAILGANCKLYRNTGTYSTPVWSEVNIVKDLTLNLEAGEADTTTRAANGWATAIAALKKGTVEFGVIWSPGNANFDAFRRAFFDSTLVDLMVMDGDITGDELVSGLRAEMAVLNFSRSEQLTEAVSAAVKCQPGFSAHAPTWVTLNGDEDDDPEGAPTTTEATTTEATTTES